MVIVTELNIMDLTQITNNLSHSFGTDSDNQRHCDSEDVSALMEKLKAREKMIQDQFEKENDEVKRERQKLSLLVIKAQQNKAEKLLNV